MPLLRHVFKRLSCFLEDSRLAGEGLEAADDDVTVAGIVFQKARRTAGLMGSDERGAGAAKGIEDNVPALGTVLDGVSDERHRFDRGVHGELIGAGAGDAADTRIVPDIGAVAAGIA